MSVPARRNSPQWHIRMGMARPASGVMGYQLLANAVLLLHFAFVTFVICGALLVVRWLWLAWIHVPAVLWGTTVEFTGWICPLTPLENSLRARAGEATYGGGCIDHYLQPLLYPDGLNRSIQMLLGVLLITFNLAVYIYITFRQRRRAASRQHA